MATTTHHHDTYTALRQRYPRFEYRDYHYHVDEEGLHLRFDFAAGDIEFHPTALVERRPFLRMEGREWDWLVFQIGMVELVSYWKSVCSPQVVVRCGALTAEQIAFWRKLYWHGLGEFFFTNGIDAHEEDFVDISCEGTRLPAPPPMAWEEGYLVPIGGGKDSVVTLELLRQAGCTIRPLIMNPRGATVECASKAGFPMSDVLVLRRSIDPTLLRLNAEGYLNGHTPFSAMLAFYTLLASALSGVRQVALSNESSANESTVLGSSVNHQYSKSLEFEDDFRAYVEALGCGTRYFSFLRPLQELQIAMIFSRLTDYHDVFRSCNVGSKQDVWCGHCAKCLFAYLILSPFIAPERMAQIFGRAMLDDMTLLPEMQQLAGLAPTKPFECVGTVDEVWQAIAMTQRRWYADALPPLLAALPKYGDRRPISLQHVATMGNLTAVEMQILEQACTVKNN